jgi:hypothetical protein
MPKADVEVQMLYGIQRAAQERLANEGYRSMVLTSYGSHWYPLCTDARGASHESVISAKQYIL